MPHPLAELRSLMDCQTRLPGNGTKHVATWNLAGLPWQGACDRRCLRGTGLPWDLSKRRRNGGYETYEFEVTTRHTLRWTYGPGTWSDGRVGDES